MKGSVNLLKTIRAQCSNSPARCGPAVLSPSSGRAKPHQTSIPSYALLWPPNFCPRIHLALPPPVRLTSTDSRRPYDGETKLGQKALEKGRVTTIAFTGGRTDAHRETLARLENTPSYISPITHGCYLGPTPRDYMCMGQQAAIAHAGHQAACDCSQLRRFQPWGSQTSEELSTLVTP